MNSKRGRNRENDGFGSSDSFDKLVASEKFDKIMEKSQVQRNPNSNPGSGQNTAGKIYVLIVICLDIL